MGNTIQFRTDLSTFRVMEFCFCPKRGECHIRKFIVFRSHISKISGFLASTPPIDPNSAIGHMLGLPVFLFESFLQFKVGLSLLFNALLLHVSLDPSVHRLMTQWYVLESMW